MKKYLVWTALAALSLLVFSGCGTEKKEEVVEEKPLNLSVYLDLSDRLVQNANPSQMERDTALIAHMVDRFVEHCVKTGLLKSRNHFQVLFYPAPNSSKIASLNNLMQVDLGKLKPAEKKPALVAMKDRVVQSAAQIYEDAIGQQQWLGSDIWGFFSNNVVDKYCVRKDCRNVLVILTDGYLYHVKNKQQEGDAFSYVLPKTLQNPKSSLIVRRGGLQNLEVLMLEVNPSQMTQREKMVSVLENWFREMEVGRFVVCDTDMPAQVIQVVDSFLDE